MVSRPYLCIRGSALAVLLLALGWSLQLGAQAPPSVAISLDRDRVALGQTIRLEVKAQNAQIADFTPPDLSAFVVVAGPSQEETSAIIAGQAVLTSQINYTLRPRQEGVAVILPFELRMAGRLYRTNSRRVTVLPAGTQVTTLAPDNFMRLEADRSKVFVGQQLIVNLRLYTTLNRQSLNAVEQPQFDGFIAKARSKFDHRTETVNENGRSYLVHTIESYALYPLRPGRLAIEPYVYSMSIRDYAVSPSGFRQPVTNFVNLRSDSLSVQVAPLPTPPTDFSGGIGLFSLSASTDRDSLTTDDALQLRLAISGEGDIFRIRDILPANPDDWDIYPADIEQEEMLDSPTGYMGRKIVSYQLVPRRAGLITLAPRVIVFDPDKEDFINLVEDQFEIQVVQGSGRPSYDTSSVELDSQLLVMQPSVQDLQLPSRGGEGDFRRYEPKGTEALFWILMGIPLLVIGGLGAREAIQQRAEALDPAERAQSRAAQTAYRQLRQAARQEPVRAWQSLENIMLRYLADKWQSPFSQLTTPSIQRELVIHGLDPDEASAFTELLATCASLPYSGQAITKMPPLDQARALIAANEAAQKSPLSVKNSGRWYD